jgi:eukaryotic-like serine/threonine-protein kinase
VSTRERDAKAERADASRRRQRVGILLAIALVVGAVAFGAGFLISTVLWFRTGAGAEVIAVPDLRGQTEQEARTILRRVDLELELGPSLENPDVPEGQILAQSPLPGEEVAPRSAVRIVVSAGPETRAIPDLSSLRGSQAREMLTRYGFDTEVEERVDDSPAGRVLSITPRPGTRVAMPATVRLVVSAGPPLERVPLVVGMDEDSARRTLEGAGFSVGEAERDFFSAQPAGTVVAQSPWGDAEVPRGSRIGLIVSAGGNP